MAPLHAFVAPLSSTAFTGRATAPSLTRAAPCVPATAAPSRRALRMAQDPPPKSTFMEPQPGDPGYKPLPPVPKGTGMAKSEPRPSQAKAKKGDDEKSSDAVKLPVLSGDVRGTGKRGLDLLKEDFLKRAPERAGVGRQDREALTMKPMSGEPGFKPQSYETVKVSELGISPFPDDKNAVGKVGGIAAVKKAAIEVKSGEKTAKQIKKALLNIKTKSESEIEYDIPDYLKPIPEDTPRKGLTWKNYTGR